MDDEVIRILISIKQFSQSVRQIRQVADEVKKVGTATTNQSKAASSANAAFQRDLRLRKNSINQMHRDESKAQADKDNAFKQQMISNAAAARQQQRIQAAQNAASAKAFNQAGALIRKQQALTNNKPVLGRFSPAQRLQNQMGVLQGAIASGNPASIFDAQYGAHMLHQRVQQAKNFMNPMSIQARNITNFMAPFRSLSSAIGEIARPVLGVAAAFGALVIATFELTKHIAETGVALMRLGFTAGGTPTETGQLSTLGNVLGVDMGQLARQFAQEISHGGIAGGFAARAGIHDFGIFDTTNKAQKLLAWIKYMESLSPTEAIRAARAAPGTEALLPLRNLSQQSKDMMMQNEMVKGNVFDEQFQKDSLNFMAALANISEAFTNFVGAVIKPFLPEITQFLNEVATGFNVVAMMINEHKDTFKAFVELFINLFTGNIAGAMKAFEDMKKSFETGTSGSIEAHTNAMNRHAAALDTWSAQNGTYGGGERARGALPSKWTGMNMERNVAEARRLGAFAL